MMKTKMNNDTTNIRKQKKVNKDMHMLLYKMGVSEKAVFNALAPLFQVKLNQRDDDDTIPAGARFRKMFEEIMN